MTNKQQVEVVVVGGGLAGAATALALARLGRQVLLIEKSDGLAFKIGEGLPPAAKPLLQELGVMAHFMADGHQPSYGNHSAWGSPVLHGTDFIRHPHGHGWHLDRARFDGMFRTAAQEAGADVRLRTGLTAWQRCPDDNWLLTLSTPDGITQINCQWLIDATGRASWLARRLGIKRQHDDQLVGFFALFQPQKSDDRTEDVDFDSLTLIEAVPDGWWYTARLPGSRRVVVYFTDPAIESYRLARSAEGYLSLLKQTEHIAARLAKHGYRMSTPPKGTAANSGRLEQVVGDGWLAVGDAAIAFDPLSSQGILTALYSALKAAQALDAHLVGDAKALEQYRKKIKRVYDAYLQNRTTYYRYERRWLESEFWKISQFS